MRYTVPHSSRDANLEALPPALVEQVRLSVLLGYGFAFSLFPMGGIGSLIAFVIGWQALGRIRRSGGRLAGLWLAWWCIVVGGLGALFLPQVIFWKIVKSNLGSPR